MNRRLAGSCQVPIAGYATLDADQIWLRGLVADPDSGAIFRAEQRGAAHQAAEIGEQVAEQLCMQGADRVLARLRGETP